MSNRNLHTGGGFKQTIQYEAFSASALNSKATRKCTRTVSTSRYGTCIAAGSWPVSVDRITDDMDRCAVTSRRRPESGG